MPWLCGIHVEQHPGNPYLKSGMCLVGDHLLEFAVLYNFGNGFKKRAGPHPALHSAQEGQRSCSSGLVGTGGLSLSAGPTEEKPPASFPAPRDCSELMAVTFRL